MNEVTDVLSGRRVDIHWSSPVDKREETIVEKQGGCSSGEEKRHGEQWQFIYGQGWMDTRSLRRPFAVSLPVSPVPLIMSV